MLQWLKFPVLLLPLLVCIPLLCTQSTYYITPTPDTPCPGDPCHTLSQYEDQYFKNFSSNTTLVFLPGDHTLNRTISIGTAWGNFQPDYHYPHPSLTLRGYVSSLPEVTSRIVCTWPVGFAFSGITELNISALAFISCGHNDTAAVSIQSVCSINVSKCSFQNSANRNGFGGAIYVHNGTLTLANNTFQHNFAAYGGALEVSANNTITLLGNVFQSNSAAYGGALHTNANNTLTLSENTFLNNSANSGGALYASTNNNLTLSENIFQSNAAELSGGALEVSANNTITLFGNTLRKNSADFGGALYAQRNNTLTFSKNIFQNNFVDYGGALYAFMKNNLTLFNNTFQNNSAINGGALFASINNTLTLSVNTFENNCANGFLNNTGDGTGGAFFAYENNTLTLSGNTFHSNSADYSGGGLTAGINNTITLSKNVFQNNSADGAGGTLFVYTQNSITLSENTFQNNSANIGGVLYASTNNALTFSDNTFEYNSADGYLNNFDDDHSGGALYALENNTLILLENIFRSNSADYGGALYVFMNSTLTLCKNTFQNNSANNGGVLYTSVNNTLTLSENIFENNSADGYQNNPDLDGSGGALYGFANNSLTLSTNIFKNNSATFGGALYAYINSTLTLFMNTFQNNSADYNGGAVNANTNITLTLSENTFQSNSANFGGAVLMYINDTLVLSKNMFQNNSADYGGAILAFMNNTLTLVSNTFQNNSVTFGGGALYVRQSTVQLTDNLLAGNTAKSSGGAILCLKNSDLSMYGSHRLQNNTAQYGGGIAALECRMVLAEGFFESNEAEFGGGLYTDQSQVCGFSNFSSNRAKGDGGGIYASSSEFYFKKCISFLGNSAQNGGGLLLTKNSKIYLQPNTTIDFINNSVNQNGGAIKVETDNPLSSCVQIPCELAIQSDCFFQIQTQAQYDITETNISEITDLRNVRMYFTNNRAEAGANLYGGSIDNCSLSFIKSQVQPDIQVIYQCPKSGKVFDYISNSAPDLSSDPQYICICKDGEPDCRVSSIAMAVYPGSKMLVPVIAYGQRKGTTPAVINITPRGKITIDELENIQNITNSCTFLNFSVQSTAVRTSQQMILHIHGSCPPQERKVSSEPTNFININVSILPCPPGFENQDQPTCECAQRLKKFTSMCRIDDGKIERTPEFWVGYMPNSTSDGLILHPHCPFDYCTPKTMYIAVDDSDEQCSSNRTGILCGKCSQNFSLALGGNHCLQCSNDYLSLIVAFAFAGVALVLLLFVLRLTVAVGTINGLLFYANIFAVNSSTFLQPQSTNILTVSIAWMNLDLGIETCFYDGMDSYTKTWLQFVFPLYVWGLVIAIIVISHYSIRISTMLSNSTVEVLATLILLSYAKLLRTFITALVYTRLDYPNNSQIAVWLYDANIPYLSSKHVPLFIATMICLVLLFLPYTLFLTFGQWLRAKSGWRIFSWVNHHRVLPFLEAYHAPYTDKHRYWTGLLLLVRCILFLVFAFRDASVNLLCIGSTTAMLLVLTIVLGKKVYKTWSLNVLESFFIGNLLILVLATLYIRSIPTEANQNAAAFTSLSTVFAAFIGIIIYHSVQQAKEAPRWWKRIFPSHRNDYETVTRTGVSSKPKRMHSPSLSVLPDACPTVAYINVFDSAQVQSLELQDSACMETNLLQNTH